MSYTLGIPAANNNPSSDQPLIQNNFTAINNLVNIDHVTFGASGQGQHQQVTFHQNTAPAAPTDPTSILYTTPGTASTKVDMRFRNANGIFPVNLIRAYGVFDGAGATLGSQTLNLTCSGWGAGTGYVMAVPANILTGTAYGVLISPNQPTLTPLWGIGYTIASATAFNIGFRRVDNNAFAQPTDGFTAIVYQL